MSDVSLFALAAAVIAAILLVPPAKLQCGPDQPPRRLVISETSDLGARSIYVPLVAFKP